MNNKRDVNSRTVNVQFKMMIFERRPYFRKSRGSALRNLLNFPLLLPGLHHARPDAYSVPKYEAECDKSLYHRNSPFSPFSFSCLGSVAGLPSLNPRFLNSSLAMRFLHTRSTTTQCQNSEFKRTYPSYSSDMISPNSDIPHRSSLSLF
jgi:hypothetical protein